MKRTFLFFTVFASLWLTSCLKDDPSQGTIALMGTEADVKPIDQVIPDTLLHFIGDSNVMHNQVIDLPAGVTPPDIQGEFMFAPRELFAYNHHFVPNDTVRIRFGGDPSFLSTIVTDTIEIGVDTVITETDTILKPIDSLVVDTVSVPYYLEGQHNMLVPVDIYGDVIEKGNQYNKKQANGYVMGSGKRFTAYFAVDYACEMDGVDFAYRRGYVVTGEIAPEGIKNAVMAIVNMDVVVDGNSIYANFPEKDWIYVYRAKSDDSQNPFGVAIRQNWYE